MPYGNAAGVKGWLPAGQSFDNQTGKPPSEATVNGMLQKLSDILDLVFGVTTDATQISVRTYYVEREAAYAVMTIKASVADQKAPALYLDYHKEWLALFPEGVVADVFATSSDVPWSHTRDADPTDQADDRNPSFTKDYVP